MLHWFQYPKSQQQRHLGCNICLLPVFLWYHLPAPDQEVWVLAWESSFAKWNIKEATNWTYKMSNIYCQHCSVTTTFEKIYLSKVHKRRNRELPKQSRSYQGQLFPWLLSILPQHLVQPIIEPAKENQKRTLEGKKWTVWIQETIKSIGHNSMFLVCWEYVLEVLLIMVMRSCEQLYQVTLNALSIQKLLISEIYHLATVETREQVDQN